MNLTVLPLVLLGVVIAVIGLVVSWRTSNRFRKELGLRQETEKTQDVSFIISAFHDVTRQLKEKEKELERLKVLAESRAENILQCVSNGVIAFDENGRVNTLNRAAEELLGTSRERAVGSSCSDLFASDELCGEVERGVREKRASGRRETALVLRGEPVWLGFNTALLTDRHGNSQGVILSFSDLTEVKRLQQQMELKERLTALGEMSAGIAHELRNPMAVISGYLKLLAKKQDAPGQDIIRDITAEIAGMNRIIGDLLTFARPTALNRVSVNLREVLAACVESAVPGGSSAGGALRTSLEIDDVDVLADEGLLRQAFGNILQNAVDAMPDGGVLTVQAAGDGNAVVRVGDTGHGIAEENIGRIFLPFFTTRADGVGMGLALTHKIITAHGGRIDVESRTGRGTTFTITLPRGR